MKQFLLIACILIGSFSAAHAGNGLTQSANDSAINAGKSALNAKIAQLQTAYASNPSSTVSVQLTNDVEQLLRTGMSQTKNAINLAPSKTTKTSINSRYLSLELSRNAYHKLASNPGLNHSELLRQAQAFYAKY